MVYDPRAMSDLEPGFRRVCQTCGRRVPRSVAVCRCGATLAPVTEEDAPADATEARSDFGAGFRAAVALLAAAALLGFVGYRVFRGEPEHPPAPQPTVIRPPAQPSLEPAADAVAGIPAGRGRPGAALPAAPGDSSAPAGVSSLEDVVSRVMPAVVLIETPTGRGSGFYVKPDTLLTNVHVVENNASVTIRRIDGTTAVARVDAKAAQFDIAVLKTTDALPSQATIALGTVTVLRVGQEVFAIGSALGTLQNTVTRGIISAVRQSGGATLVQTDAASNPGSSGGPLLDRGGTAIGITTMGYRGMQGLNFAVAIDHARAVLEGRVTLPSAGTGTQTDMRDLSPATPAVQSDVDRVRAEGERTYERRLGDLEREANDVDVEWRRFRQRCYSGSLDVPYGHEWFALLSDRPLPGTVSSGCDGPLTDMKRLATEFREAMRRADEAARVAGVYPGVRRDARRRHRLESSAWD